MASLRRRFTPAERAAFTDKTKVEWLNGSVWRPGIITGTIQTDDFGYEYVGVLNQGSTRRISHGCYVRGLAKHVRLPGNAPLPDVPSCASAAAVQPQSTESESALF
ncbi:hypothetical protein ACFQ1S_02045 [Kibdelosporangium lantanae]|uniref:Uncharacterized protein n=1 Tax=Kibdelosporangium lantanae TaxID=1497396 RepID=A0ABW3M3C4_9PSEU